MASIDFDAVVSGVSWCEDGTYPVRISGSSYSAIGAVLTLGNALMSGEDGLSKEDFFEGIRDMHNRFVGGVGDTYEELVEASARERFAGGEEVTFKLRESESGEVVSFTFVGMKSIDAVLGMVGLILSPGENFRELLNALSRWSERLDDVGVDTAENNLDWD